MPWRILQASLVLRVEPEEKRLSGYAELLVRPRLRNGDESPATSSAELRLNCRQCRVVAVEVDGVAAHFEHSDFLSTIVREGYRDLDAYYVNYRAALCASDEGELCIHLPSSAASSGGGGASSGASSGGDGGERRVRVWYELVDPTAGITFARSRNSTVAMKRGVAGAAGAQSVCMYTHEAPGGSGTTLSGGGGARAWFPCFDAPGAAYRCPFKLEITVPIAFKAVAGGSLLNETNGYFARSGDAASSDGGGGGLCTAAEPSTAAAPARVPTLLRDGCRLMSSSSARAAGPGGRSAAGAGAAAGAAATHTTYTYFIAQSIPARAVGLAVGTFGYNKSKKRSKRPVRQHQLGSSRGGGGSGGGGRGHGGGGRGGRSGGGGARELDVKTVVEHYYLPDVSMEEMRTMKPLLNGVVFHALRLAMEMTTTPYPFRSTVNKGGGRNGRASCVETHRQVFVCGGVPHGVAAFASLSIISADDLFDKRTCDAPTERRIEAAQQRGVAAQWFICSLDVESWDDAWVLEGLAGLLAARTAAELHRDPPHNFPGRQSRIDPSYEQCARHVLCRAICDMEDERARLDQQRPLAPAPSAVWQCVPSCPAGDELAALKAPYVMRMLSGLVGEDRFWKEIGKLCSKVEEAATPSSASGALAATGGDDVAILSTEQILKLWNRYFQKSGGGIQSRHLSRLDTFARQWIYGTGYPILTVRCAYNRKKNECIVEAKQIRGSRESVLAGGGRAAQESSAVSASASSSSSGSGGRGGRSSSAAIAGSAHGKGKQHALFVEGIEGDDAYYEARKRRALAADGQAFRGTLGLHLAVRKKQKAVGGDEDNNADKEQEHELMVTEKLVVDREMTEMRISVRNAEKVRKQSQRGKKANGPAKKKQRREKSSRGGMPAPMARGISLATQQQQHHNVNDTPVLWMRIDPHFLWLRRIVMELPTENALDQIMLRDQLRWRGGEKDGCCVNRKVIRQGQVRNGGFARWSAKLDALDALAALPRPGSEGIGGGGGALNAIKDCLCDKSEDIRVRVAAAQALATWQNNHAPRSSAHGAEERSAYASWAGSTALRSFYKAEYFVPGDANSPLANAPLFAKDALQLSHVELKKATAYAIGRIRAGDGYALDEDVKFLLNILCNNDNTGSVRRDDYLHAALVESVACAAAHLRSHRATRRLDGGLLGDVSDGEDSESEAEGDGGGAANKQNNQGDEEAAEWKTLLDEALQVLRRKLHFDRIDMFQSYRGVVGAACIRGLAAMEASHPSIPSGTFAAEIAPVTAALVAEGSSSSNSSSSSSSSRTTTSSSRSSGSCSSVGGGGGGESGSGGAAVPPLILRAILWGVATTLAARKEGGSTRLEMRIEGCRNSFSARLLPQHRDAARGMGGRNAESRKQILRSLSGSALSSESWIKRAEWLLSVLDSSLCADLEVRNAAEQALVGSICAARVDETPQLSFVDRERERRWEEMHPGRPRRSSRRGVELLRHTYVGAQPFVSQLWLLINESAALRPALRVHALQLYRTLFGTRPPLCTIVGSSEVPPLHETKPADWPQLGCLKHFLQQHSVTIHPCTERADSTRLEIFRLSYPVAPHIAAPKNYYERGGTKIRLKPTQRGKFGWRCCMLNEEDEKKSRDAEREAIEKLGEELSAGTKAFKLGGPKQNADEDDDDL